MARLMLYKNTTSFWPSSSSEDSVTDKLFSFVGFGSLASVLGTFFTNAVRMLIEMNLVVHILADQIHGRVSGSHSNKRGPLPPFARTSIQFAPPFFHSHRHHLPDLYYKLAGSLNSVLVVQKNNNWGWREQEITESPVPASVYLLTVSILGRIQQVCF